MCFFSLSFNKALMCLFRIWSVYSRASVLIWDLEGLFKMCLIHSGLHWVRRCSWEEDADGKASGLGEQHQRTEGRCWDVHHCWRVCQSHWDHWGASVGGHVGSSFVCSMTERGESDSLELSHWKDCIVWKSTDQTEFAWAASLLIYSWSMLRTCNLMVYPFSGTFLELPDIIFVLMEGFENVIVGCYVLLKGWGRDLLINLKLLELMF